jgi:hypothetical protein
MRGMVEIFRNAVAENAMIDSIMLTPAHGSGAVADPPPHLRRSATPQLKIHLCLAGRRIHWYGDV